MKISIERKTEVEAFLLTQSLYIAKKVIQQQLQLKLTRGKVYSGHLEYRGLVERPLQLKKVELNTSRDI